LRRKGDSQQIDFSSNLRSSHTPNQNGMISFPVLVCDTIDIDPGLIGGMMKNATHDYYNLIFDQPLQGT
jgi:hypothetical protein